MGVYRRNLEIIPNPVRICTFSQIAGGQGAGGMGEKLATIIKPLSQPPNRILGN
ncbi:hypothetical protein LYNGBM3L_42670 [Moorena producens 3L]|uniref:Uncharacterized protein n=1 Tax=Moorena producens 3L TaxID=489825 RepID=F4XWI6_9CYAN|nr:hypothetical protein LYNGBM3L_42670 [Moorena producens 3L]